MQNDKDHIPKISYIYVIIDPISHDVVYVGKTDRTLSERLKSHRSQSILLRPYLLELAELKEKPIMLKVDVCTNDNWQEKEKHWIDFYRNIYPNLLNITAGGFGTTGTHWSEDRIKASANLNTIPVFCKDVKTGEVLKFNSRTLAADFLKVTPEAISVALKRLGCVGGYMVSNNEEFKQTTASVNYRKAIVSISPTGETANWDSIKQAAECLNLNQSYISKVVRGVYSQCKGYKLSSQER